MPISVDGISTGLDTTGLIDAILSTYTIPKANTQEKLSDTESQKGHFTELASLMETVQNTLDAIDLEDELASVSSTDNTAFSATTQSSADTRDYRVRVDALAQETVLATQSFGDKSSTGVLATGTYTVSVGGTETEITLDGTNNSVEDFAEALDAVDGVDAYVISNDGAYQLIVRATDTGVDNAVSVTATNVDNTGGLTTPTITETQAAADAVVNIDGNEVTSSSNEVSGAIPDVTLHLTQESSSAELLRVAPDSAASIQKIEAFVEAYNAVLSKIDAQSYYNEDSESRGAFVGESTVRRVERNLRGIISTDYENSGAFSRLSELGVTTDDGGKLSLDTDALQTALEGDYESVVAFFTDNTGFARSASDVLDLIVDPIDGTIQSRVDSLDAKIEDLTEQIDRWDLRIASQEEILRAQFNNMEAVVGQLENVRSLVTSVLTTSTDSNS